VDPDLQDKGNGLIIWKYIEQKFPETKIWKTETPGFSLRNHHFYVNKCGFKVYKIENPKDKRESSYLLEKIMSS
jgi:N-acetylglutamate synthase-like GNAT family acetyltransferase